MACEKEFLLKKSSLDEDPGSAVSQMDDLQNIISLYKLQSAFAKWEYASSNCCEAWWRWCKYSNFHIASSLYMLDLPSHQPFIHVYLIEGSGELELLMSVLLSRVKFKAFWCSTLEKLLYEAGLPCHVGKSFTTSCGEGVRSVGDGDSVLQC